MSLRSCHLPSPFGIVREEQKTLARLVQPADRSDPGERCLGKNRVHGVTSFLIRCSRDQTSRLVHCQVNLLGRFDRDSIDYDPVPLDVHRRLRIAPHRSVEAHPSSTNQCAGLRAGAVSELRKGASQADFAVVTGSHASMLLEQPARPRKRTAEGDFSAQPRTPRGTIRARIFGKGDPMAHQHPPRFLKIVDDARSRIRETDVDAVKSRLDRGDKFLLVDVREESEFAKDHLPGAIHLGKGVIERDVEARVPDLNAEMILYCGGGFRSALAADNLQKMGYTKVISMDGGIRGWREKFYPLVKD